MSWQPNPDVEPSTVLQLNIRANRLKDMDTFSKSDPLCVLFREVGRLSGNRRWEEVGRTETISNCLNPEWSTSIQIQYMFEERQPLLFKVYDVDCESRDLSRHDFLGEMKCELAEIVGSKSFTRALGGLKGDCGTLSVTATDMATVHEYMQMSVCGKKLDRKDFFGKSDPFLNIYRIDGSTSKTLVHRTEFHKRTLNPTWNMFEVNLSALCGNDKSKNFLMECWDYNINGSHNLIGTCTCSAEKLLSKEVSILPLINEKKQKKKKSYKDSGTLHFVKVLLSRRYSFYDFIEAGCELEFMVAIDFTASNGSVHNPGTLHYISPGVPNQYELAIRAVVDILSYYNRSQMYSTYGFGAKVPPTGAVSHLFPMGSGEGSVVQGLHGILEAYHRTIHNITLYGPTNFAEVINCAVSRASRFASSPNKYQILLLLTDGVICDMEATKLAIIAGSSTPLSIIIVGVGNDTFESMVELDSDDQLLSAGGRKAQRDIVQFVPLRDFLKPQQRIGASLVNAEMAMELLAKEVLAEIPAQLTSFMRSRNFAPPQATNGHAAFDGDAMARQSIISHTSLPSAPAY